MFWNIFRFKVNEVLENIDADLSGLFFFFKEASFVHITCEVSNIVYTVTFREFIDYLI